MDLAEFREELTEPLYERLVDEGFTTARSVIEANIDSLLEIEGLTEDRIRSIKEMMNRELEEAEIDEELENNYTGETKTGSGQQDAPESSGSDQDPVPDTEKKE